MQLQVQMKKLGISGLYRISGLIWASCYSWYFAASHLPEPKLSTGFQCAHMFGFICGLGCLAKA